MGKDLDWMQAVRQQRLDRELLPRLLLALVLPVAWAVSIALPLHGEDYLVWKSPWAFRLFLPVILSGMAVAALLKVEPAL